MRLIDWDKVLEWMHRQKETTEQWSMRIAIENYVDDMPTVDAEPMKHGHWIVKGVIEYDRSFGGILYEPVYKCSCCGNLTESYVRMDEPIFPEDADYPSYCPNCGAKMDEDNAEQRWQSVESVGGDR